MFPNESSYSEGLVHRKIIAKYVVFMCQWYLKLEELENKIRVAHIPQIIADRRESALYKFGTALGP